MDEESESPADRVRTILLSMQLVIIAMTMGAVIFMVVAVILRTQPAWMARPAGSPVLTYVVLGFAAIQLVSQAIFPRVMAARACRAIGVGDRPEPYHNPVPSLWSVYRRQLLVGATTLAGPCFLALFVYLLNGELVCLVAASLLLIGIIARFPTHARVDSWVERQQEWMREGQIAVHNTGVREDRES
jgi:hypothetical protein